MTKLIPLFTRHNSDDADFAQFVAPHIKTLFRMAWRWTQNEADAEDLVQDVLIKVLAQMPDLRTKDKPGPWLVKILYHRYVDLYRHRRSSPVDGALLLDEAFIPDDQPGGKERYLLQKSLQKALNTLEAAQREVVILHDVEGYTALETGEIMDISVGTVKSRLHRARNKLKAALGDGTF